jgi:hypothetical protein
MPSKRNEYYLLLEGETSGPHTLEELHQMWQAEKITLDTLYVEPGMAECKPVNTILNKVSGFKKPEAQRPEGEQLVLDIERVKMGRWVVRFCVAVAIVGLLIWSYYSIMRPAKAPPVPVFARIELSMTTLTVINRNAYDWEKKTICLNGKPPDGYKVNVPVLAVGGSMQIPLINFADTQGVRFEPWRLAVSEVWIGDEKEGYRMYGIRRTQ